MVINTFRLLIRGIWKAGEGLRESGEDLIAKRGLESIGIRRKPIENILRNEFETVFGDGLWKSTVAPHRGEQIGRLAYRTQ